MPHENNTDRRHHVPKIAFKIQNWPAYEAGLRRRGSLTLWALVQTPILNAMWNDIGQRIQRAANLQVLIEAQFASEPPPPGVMTVSQGGVWLCATALSTPVVILVG